MSGDVEAMVGRLERIGDRVSVPCPDGIEGCLVNHYRVQTNPVCAEAVAMLRAQQAENEQLRGFASRFASQSCSCGVTLSAIMCAPCSARAALTGGTNDAEG